MEKFTRKPPLSRLMGLLGTITIVLIILAALLAAWALRDKEIEGWRRQMGSMSKLLADQMTESLLPMSEALDDLAHHARMQGVRSAEDFREKLATQAVHEHLRARISRLSIADVATYVANNGDNINFSRSHPVSGINLADRDYFQAHRDNPDLGFFLSAPVQNRGNGKWTFYLSKRISGDAGQFLGVVLIGVSVEKITQFFGLTVENLGKGSSISLLRDDMKLMARWPHKDEMMGMINKTGSAYQIIKVQRQREGTILTDSPRFSTGMPEKRMGAVHAVRVYPLYVLTVVTDDLYLSNWYESVQYIAALTSASVLLLGAGLAGLVKSLRRREADMQTMQRLKSEAEAASLAKSAFLATMSHEIRTPMNGILGMAQLLQLSSLQEDERKRYAQTLVNSGQSLMALLNDILDSAKMEAGKQRLHPRPVNVHETMQEVAQLFAVTAHSKDLKLSVHWHGEPQVWYAIDPIRLRQMLSNLVSNAIKFSTRGSIQIVGRQLNRNQHPVHLEFSVLDEGIGISAADQSRLFKPFSQVDSSLTRQQGGSGLGLSTVKSLARLMGGDAGVDSRPGQGSRFWFWIVAEPETTRPEADTSQVRGEGWVQAWHETQGLGERCILVVEDDRTNQLVMSALLEKLGCQVQMVTDGEQAVQAATSDPRPDLVFMDVEMPNMGGIEATRLIRQWESSTGRGRIPILALTAGTRSSDERVCTEAGMDDFLEKPVRLEEIRSQIKRWLDEK